MAYRASMWPFHGGKPLTEGKSVSPDQRNRHATGFVDEAPALAHFDGSKIGRIIEKHGLIKARLDHPFAVGIDETPFFAGPCRRKLVIRRPVRNIIELRRHYHVSGLVDQTHFTFDFGWAKAGFLSGASL